MIRLEPLDDIRHPSKMDYNLEIHNLKIDVKELNTRLIEIGAIVHNISGIQTLYDSMVKYIDMTKEVPELKERITAVESKLDLLIDLMRGAKHG